MPLHVTGRPRLHHLEGSKCLKASISGSLMGVIRKGPYHGHDNLRFLPDSSAGKRIKTQSPVFACNDL